ncbi:hypothetical protein GGG16DRAFT_94823 [Schizophyllum commune]
MVAADTFNHVLVGGNISLLPLLMRAQIKAGLIGGEVYVAGFGPDDISSAAVWFGPDQELLDSPEQGAAGFNEFMGSITEGTRTWWTSKFFPFYGATTTEAFGEGFKKANWHLQLLATEPRAQRKGLATALIKAGPTLQLVAREKGKALTVETETEGALKFYKDTGFVLKAEKPVPLDGAEGVEDESIPMYVLWKQHKA